MTAVGIVNWSVEDDPGLSVLTVMTKSSAEAGGAPEAGSPGNGRKPDKINEANKTRKNLGRKVVCNNELPFYSGLEDNN